jgi:hypothetical protein
MPQHSNQDFHEVLDLFLGKTFAFSSFSAGSVLIKFLSAFQAKHDITAFLLPRQVCCPALFLEGRCQSNACRIPIRYSSFYCFSRGNLAIFGFLSLR